MMRFLQASTAILVLFAAPAAAQDVTADGRYVEFGGIAWTPGTGDGAEGPEIGIGAFTTYRRNPDFGAFTGASVDGFVIYGGGLQGLLYTEDITYFAALEAIDATSTSDPAFGGILGGTYFLSPNTALSGATSLGFGAGEGSDVLIGFGIGAEHRFASTPLSIGADYAFTTAGDGTGVIHAATLNMTYAFGADSRRDEQRPGPGFPGGLSVFNLFGF